MQNQVQIASIEPYHWQAAYELCSLPQVARFLGGDPSDPPEMWQKRFLEIDPGQHYRLGAFYQNSLLGLISLEIFTSPRTRHSAKLWMAVTPAWQGQGVGALLLSTALSNADRWLNLLRIELQVHSDHERAITLYARNGFQVEGERRCDMLRDGTPVNAFTMSRIRAGFTQGEIPESNYWSSERKATPYAPIQLREAVPTDADGIAALFDDDSVSWGTLQFPHMPRTFWRARLRTSLEDNKILVAEDEENIAGMLGIFGIQNPRMSHIRSLFMVVGRAYQGQGVGRRLMQAGLSLCDGPLDARRVDLTVYTDNTRAISLYQRFGFEIEGRLRYNAYREGFYVDSFLMSRIRG